MLLALIGFCVSMAAILVISRKNLALGLTCGAVLLGLFTLSPSEILEEIIRTVTDQSIVLLAVAMGIIPMLGGTMKESGQVDSLVNNVRLKRRYLLPFSAALMGLLPMPGGALLSAPILEKGGQGVKPGLVAAINNWFRHLFILVYPLSPALIVAAKIADLDVYVAVSYALPWAALAYILGYIFFLRKVNGRMDPLGAFSMPGLVLPLAVILSAPVIDFTLKRLFSLGSLATVIGVTTGLALSILLSRRRLDLASIARRMKPWNFAMIIIGMFLYLHVFQKSHASDMIATIPLPPVVLAVAAGSLLAFLTGRVQLPASIILPVYLATADVITPMVFALIYCAIFFGYIISPVHPCLVVTCEYFHVPIRDMLHRLAWPTAVIVGLAVAIALALDLGA